jgi:D-beta-D-heptose 7-phosphate kinase/D-beta-D-heptose 1-phosphate adenosyltransferase
MIIDSSLPERSLVENLVSHFVSQRILVLGDYMLDQFIWGRVERISPEAPVPVVNVERESFSAGGAGNVAMNIAAMGARVFSVGFVGGDTSGDHIIRLLEKEAIDTLGLLRIERSTTVKTRIVAHQQQVVRVDREEQSPPGVEVERDLAAAFRDHLPSVDAVIISDYAKGCVTPGLLSNILPAANAQGRLVCVDPKVRYFSSYSPVTVVTPNQLEAAGVISHPISNDSELEAAGHRILQMIDCKSLLITLGNRGMALFDQGEITLIPACAREVYDVTGAGDTVISILALALAAGASMLDAVKLTNVAAGIVVGKIGTATATPQELISGF